MLNFGIGATKRTKKNPCPPAKKTTARKKAAPKARATAAPKARKPKALMPSATSIYAQGTMLPAVIAKPKTVRKRKAAAPKAATTTAAPKTRRKSCKGLTPSQCYRLNAGIWKSYKTPLQEACSEAGYATKNAFFGYSRKRAATKLAKCNWLKGGYINRQKGLVRTKKKYTSL